MVKLDQQAAPSSATESFVDYQSRMVNSAKEIARLSQDMVTKATIDPSKLPQLSQDLSHHYTQVHMGIRRICNIFVIWSMCFQPNLNCLLSELFYSHN